AIGTADGEKLAQLLAVVVGLDQLRTGEIGAARAAAGGRSVTEPALRCQQLLSAFDGRWVELRFGGLLRTQHDGTDQHKGREGHKGYKGHKGKCPDGFHDQFRSWGA